MNGEIAASLLGLALVDSVSFGTLLIPVWLLLTPGRVRPGRVAHYLGAVTLFYFVAGLTLVAGAHAVIDVVLATVDDVPRQTVLVGQLVIGIVVIALGLRLETRAKRQAACPGRLGRWRETAMTATGEGKRLVRLAVVAAALEISTMVPYLIAIGRLTNADVSTPTLVLALAAYCLVMTLPAGVLTIARVLAHDRLEPLLRKVGAWFTRNSATAIGWTVGVVGIALTINAVVALDIG